MRISSSPDVILIQSTSATWTIEEAESGGASPISRTVTSTVPNFLGARSSCKHCKPGAGCIISTTLVSFTRVSREQLPPVIERFNLASGLKNNKLNSGRSLKDETSCKTPVAFCKTKNFSQFDWVVAKSSQNAKSSQSISSHIKGREEEFAKAFPESLMPTADIRTVRPFATLTGVVWILSLSEPYQTSNRQICFHHLPDTHGEVNKQDKAHGGPYDDLSRSRIPSLSEINDPPASTIVKASLSHFHLMEDLKASHLWKKAPFDVFNVTEARRCDPIKVSTGKLGSISIEEGK
nr:hypothetical protein Iba_scaffold13560CG0040 [Ipomoea batatas]